MYTKQHRTLVQTGQTATILAILIAFGVCGMHVHADGTICLEVAR